MYILNDIQYELIKKVSFRYYELLNDGSKSIVEVPVEFYDYCNGFNSERIDDALDCMMLSVADFGVNEDGNVNEYGKVINSIYDMILDSDE